MLRAELCFARHVIFTISRSEVVKMTCLLEEYSAAVGGKRLFAQTLYGGRCIKWTLGGKDAMNRVSTLNL